MLRLFSIFFGFLFLSLSVNSLTCDEIRTVFFNGGCCSGTSETCLQQIPACSATTGGKVCFDGTDVVVKGLLSSFDFTSSTKILFKKHLIPDTPDILDIGEADYKIRDIYEHQRL